MPACSKSDGRFASGDILRKIMLPRRCLRRGRRARLSMTLALVLAIVAEMVGIQRLGYAVVREQQAMRPELVFAYVVVIGALGVVLNALLTGAVAVFFPAASGRLREAG
jgi:ABC-type nitrate/sulfonate/bicarbonate transport system permease component